MENGLKNQFRAIKFRAVDIFPAKNIHRLLQNKLLRIGKLHITSLIGHFLFKDKNIIFNFSFAKNIDTKDGFIF